MWVLDWFIVDNEESLLELPEMIPIKVRDPFLRIRKKLTPCYTSRPEDRLLWPSLEGKRMPQEEGSLRKGGKKCEDTKPSYKSTKSKR